MRHLEVMPFNQTYNYKRTGFYGQFFFYLITTLVFIAQDLFDPRDFSKASVKTIFQKFAEQFSKIDGLSFASSFVAAALF